VNLHDTVLIDTSAWIEFLRGTDSPACNQVDNLLDSSIATCDPIRMEILAGATSEENLSDLRALLARATTVPVGPEHYDMGATLYRRARARGLTVRSTTDCLIAAIAIDHGIPLLTADRDFRSLAQVSDLILAH
jgi:predicted nucleic acid-binding protein